MSLPAGAAQPSLLSQWDHGSHASRTERRKSTSEDEQGLEYVEPAEGELTAPPDFRPFFTLIEDANTSEHFHPRVHYIFSDDDPDVMTSAIVDSMQERGETEPRERLLLLDVAADGKTVGPAHSLSPDWQVSQAAITPAPSWNEAAPVKGPGGLMLKITGAQGRAQAKTQEQTITQSEDAIARMENVMDGYAENLLHLQTLLDRHAFAADPNTHET